MALVQWGGSMKTCSERKKGGAQEKEQYPSWFRECVGKSGPVTPLPDDQRQLRSFTSTSTRPSSSHWIPREPLQMSKPMKPRGLTGQGAGVYKPEAIRVLAIFALT